MIISLRAGDAQHAIKKLPAASIDLTVTSPPYKDEDGYGEELIYGVAEGLWHAHKKGSLVFVNFGHLANFKQRPFDVAYAFINTGFDLKETFVWVKNHYKPIQGKRRVNNLTEFIFMFSKGKMPELDRLAVGVPYADKSNIGRYSDQDLRCAGNVWHIPYETIQSSKQKSHNDRFPIGLPLQCMKLCGYEIKAVLDPFMGHGTTALAAIEMGYDCIGFDIDKKNIAIAQAKIDEALND